MWVESNVLNLGKEIFTEDGSTWLNKSGMSTREVLR